MSRTASIIQVFVSSPGDVDEERKWLEDVIQELNVTYAKRNDIYLQTLKWETHTDPDIGVDAQDVINEQIGDGYDIFIGIMWKRFGTPTGRAGSGTEEEFNIAYKKYCENTKQIKIMFYFKDEPVPPSELDPAQLALIKEFREKLGKMGLFYWTYKNQREFESYIRMHLSSQLDGWKNGDWGKGKSSSKQVKVDESKITELDDDVGYLDLLEIGEDGLESANLAMEHMSDAVKTIGSKMNDRTLELIKEQEASPNGKIEVRTAKRIVNRTAIDMEEFADRMNTEISIFADSFSKSIDASTRAVVHYSSFDTDNEDTLAGYLEAIKNFISAVTYTIDEERKFHSIIEGLPGFTTKFIRAKKRTLSALGKFDIEMKKALDLSTELKELIEQNLDDAPKDDEKK